MLNVGRRRIRANRLSLQLLNFSGGDTWKHHMAGAARLIELRGPQNYNTDFDQALFMALAGLIVSIAFGHSVVAKRSSQIDSIDQTTNILHS